MFFDLRAEEGGSFSGSAFDYLRLTPGALYTQRYRGEKPGALGIRVGRKILYRPSDIDRFLDERLFELPEVQGTPRKPFTYAVAGLCYLMADRTVTGRAGVSRRNGRLRAVRALGHGLCRRVARRGE